MDGEYLIGKIVHFVATNAVRTDKKGAAHPDVRAMLITGVIEQDDGTHLVNGLVFRSGTLDQRFLTLASEVQHVKQNEADHFEPGTWHYAVRS